MMMDSQSKQFARVGPSAKSLLRNVIRHTDTHNRLLEEADMWQLHHKMTKAKSGARADSGSRSDDSSPDGRACRKRKRMEKVSSKSERGDLDIQNSFLYDDRSSMHGDASWRRGFKQAHMDEVTMATNGGGVGSTFWMRQLEKAEAADPDRWGHDGFKELYPKNFDSDRTDSDSKNSQGNGKSSSSKNYRKRKSKSKEAKKKAKKRKKQRESSSDSESDSDGRRERRKKRKKKKKRRQGVKKSGNIAFISDEDESDSDGKTNVDRLKKHKTGKRKRKRVEVENEYKNCTSEDVSDSRSGSVDFDSEHRENSRKKEERRRRKIGRDESGFGMVADSANRLRAKHRSKFKSERKDLKETFSVETPHKKRRRKD